LARFDDVNATRHRMMTLAAKLVADDAEGACLSRRERHDVLDARMQLDVDVGRLQREAVLPIQRRKMDPVLLAFLELKNRPELPQPAEHVDVTAGRRADHRDLVVGLLAYLELLGE